MEIAAFIAAQWLDHSKSPKQLFDEVLTEAQFAEEAGYDHVWLAEHYTLDYIAMPDPFQFAALILDRTERIGAGVAVIILRNHHPIKLAAQIAQIDVLSGGRFIAAFGRGGSGHEFRQMGLLMEPEDSRDFFYEHLGIMSKLWKSRKSEAHEGRFFSFDNATIMPPPTSPAPPFYLAALSPRSINLGVSHCVEAGIPVNIFTTQFRSPFSAIEAHYAAFLEALEEYGVRREEARFAVQRITYVAESDAKAWEITPYVLNVHRGIVGMLSDTERVIDGKVLLEPVEGEPTREEVFENCLIGGPETVRDKLRPYIELGVDHLSAYQHMGQPHAQVMDSMALFGMEVMSSLREG